MRTFLLTALISLSLVAAAVVGARALADGSGSNTAEPSKLKRVTFAVSCYDVGKSALSDLPGVADVDRGFEGTEEVNRVKYDPARITVAAMEAALRKAGTFRRTLN